MHFDRWNGMLAHRWLSSQRVLNYDENDDTFLLV